LALLSTEMYGTVRYGISYKKQEPYWWNIFPNSGQTFTNRYGTVRL